MIKFIKPENLNGTELLKELEAAGIKVKGWPSDDGAGSLWLDIAEVDEAKALQVVSTHNGITIAPDNLSAKAALLAKLGITADEAKLLLS